MTEKLERDQKRQTELRTGQAAAIPAEEQAGSTAEVVTESEDIVVDLTEESTGTGIEKELDESATAEELTSHAKLMALLTEKLPECMNRQKADEFCVSFCYLNSKSARKKLVQALARIPRNRIELIAPYARITASLARLYPEIVPPIVQSLKKEFHGMLKTKNQLYIDSKIRNVRYQAELVKFGLLPPITIFRMFKDLIVDFSVHNVELIATLLESCGRFLYLIPFTHERMNEILETVMRLKRQKNLNLQQQNILESAFYAVKPVERVKKQSKQYTVMQQYLIHLLQVRMDDPKVSIDDIIKSLRRLPWQNKEENLDYIFIKTVVKIARTKYVSIPNIADCISALSRFYPNLVIRVIDKLLEEVQRGIETPFKREPQRTLGIIRLIGELYNFAVLSSALIFELLYHVINYGHEVSKAVESTSSSTSVGLACVFNPKVFSDIDVPTDLFRAQVVCELLNTCGEYYVRGALREKMNKFLTYFQRYLLTKQFVPLHIEFCILDTMDYLEKLAKDAENTQAKKGSNMSTSLLFTRYDNWEAVQNIIEEWESVKGIAENDEEDDEEEEERRDNTDKEAVDEGGSESESDGSSGSEDESESEEDEEEEERRLAEKEEEDFSELQAAKMLEKMRVQEEDDEFEQAFKSVMQVKLLKSYFLLA